MKLFRFYVEELGWVILIGFEISEEEGVIDLVVVDENEDLIKIRLVGNLIFEVESEDLFKSICFN